MEHTFKQRTITKRKEYFLHTKKPLAEYYSDELCGTKYVYSLGTTI